MNPRTLRISVLLLSLAAASFESRAQSNPPDGRLSGTLLDFSGGGVGGVHVTAEPGAGSSAGVWKATSSTDGEYSLSLPPGSYHVEFSRTSFQTRELDVTLGSGESRRIDMRLELEPLSSNVVVTAEAQPLNVKEAAAPVTVFTREETERRRAVTLPDLLQFTPAVSIGRTGAEGGQVSIFSNGGSSSYTKVLVDGTPVNEPGNAVDFSNFTLDNLDKVELVRGAESAIYGSDAVSSVIQVFTHRGTTRVPEVSLVGEGGNFSTGRGAAQLAGKLGDFDYSGAGSYFSTDGQGRNDIFRNRTLSGNFGWRFTESNQLRVTLRNNTSNAGIPGQTALLPPDLDQRNDLHFFSGHARWQFSTGNHWHHELSASESYNREHASNPVADFFDAGDDFCVPRSASAVEAFTCNFPFDTVAKYNRASFNAQTSYLLPTIGLSAGYQYEVENGYLNFLDVGHVRRNNQGGFLDAHWRPHPRAAVTAGVRAEANGFFGTRVVPRAGASLMLLQGRGFWGETRLGVFYGEGIKEPRFDQTFGFNECTPGNPSLHPERSRTWNVGVDQYLASSRFKLSAEYFGSRFYNIISFSNLPPTGACPFLGNYFNTDLARARGMNLSAEAHVASWLSVTGQYTFDDSRVLTAPNATDPALIEGNRLFRRPVHSGSLVANAAFRALNVNLAGYFTGRRTDSDFLSFSFGGTCFGPCLTRSPGYARFDLATAYRLGRGVSTHVRVQNLFDKRYQDAIGYPALGREVRVGMNYRFGGRS